MKDHKFADPFMCFTHDLLAAATIMWCPYVIGLTLLFSHSKAFQGSC